MRYWTGAQYSYEFLTLAERQFLQRHTVGPFFSQEWNPNNLTQVRAQLQYKNFQTDPPITEENRDAFNYLLGFTHFFRFEGDRHFIKVGFEFDKEAAAGFDYSYEGMKALVGFQFTIPEIEVRFRVDGEFYLRSYRGENFLLSVAPNGPGTCWNSQGGICAKREDFEKLVLATLAKDFGRSSKACALPLPWGGPAPKATNNDCFTVSLDFLADLNRSRATPVFEYSRQVVSLGLTWRY
jgi:hypothetical protein